MSCRLLFVTTIAGALALSGCATPSTPEGMQAHSLTVANRSSEPVSISVTGGQETSAVHASKISNADFATALKQSMLASGLFPRVVDGKESGYYLEAYIGMLSQPLLGFSFTVDMEVSYKLIDLTNNTPVWQKSIKSTHTATTGDAFAGITRLRLANEGAARKNIEAAIAAMGALNLR